MKNSSKVLVLNQNFKFLDITDVTRAIGLLCKGYASVVTENYETFPFDDWVTYSSGFPYEETECIRSINFHIRIPKVIKFNYKVRGRKDLEVRFNRKNIYIRDNYTCQYCGYKPTWNNRNVLNIDHVMPKSRGGTTSWDNVVVSCISCNSKKGCKTPKEANMLLKSAPKKPTWAVKYSIFSGIKSKYKEWKNFLDVAYYNITLDN